MSLLDTAELKVRAISVPKGELVYVRSLLEASEGLGFFVARRGGDVLLVCPQSQSDELDRFVSDLSGEIEIVERDVDAYRGAFDVLA